MIHSAVIISYNKDMEYFLQELEMCIQDRNREYMILCDEQQRVMFKLSFTDNGRYVIDATDDYSSAVPNIILTGTSGDWNCVPLYLRISKLTRGFKDVLQLKELTDLTK